MSTLKFSIIIPVYNSAPYLRECLNSVLAQTFTDWEAICVDDGSTDGSGVILDEYAAKDKRFRVIHQKNAGVSAARNAALDVTQGEWIWFVDSDDYILTGALRQFVDTKCKADINFFNTTFLFKGGVKRACILDSGGLVEDMMSRGELLKYLVCNETGVNLLGYTWNKFFRAEVIRANNLRFVVGLSRSEDEVFTLAVACRAKSVQVLPLDFYVYRWSETGLTHNPCPNLIKLVQAFENIAMGSEDEPLRKLAYCRAAQNGRVLLWQERTVDAWRHYKRLIHYSTWRHANSLARLAKFDDWIAIVVIRILLMFRKMQRLVGGIGRA